MTTDIRRYITIVEGQYQTAFKHWFGNSKVVDDNGDPLVVYHGTNKDFEIFRKGRVSKGDNSFRRDANVGIWFTQNSDAADYYTWPDKHNDKDGGQIYPVFLRIENPRIIDFNGNIKNPDRISLAAKKAKEEGQDGIILKNVRDAANTRTNPEDIFIVFNPKQIKSAIGNNGNFNQNDPRISEGEFKPVRREVKINHSTGSYTEYEDHIEIESIRTPVKYRMHGDAHKVIKEITDFADEREKPAKLIAGPLDKKTRTDKLVQFYQKHGFELTGKIANMAGDPWMERQPR